MISYKRKIYLDRTLGSFVIFWVKFITRIVGIILKRDHSVPQKPKSIAIAKYMGLGSIVYSAALCLELKRKFPDTKIIYITRKSNVQFLKRIKNIDKVLYIDDKNLIKLFISVIFLIKNLWKEKLTLYFDMEVYSTFSSIIATFSLATNRYGFYLKSADFKKWIHTHTIYFNITRHISEIYSQLSILVNGKKCNNFRNIFALFKEDYKACNNFIENNGFLNKKIVLINANASELMLERRWNKKSWVELLSMLDKEFPDLIYLLVGAPNEKEYVSSIFNMLPDKNKNVIFNVVGVLSIGAYLALIEKSLLMVTCDSGPFHFAEALNTPTVSLWGPCSPTQYGPTHSDHSIIYNEACYCSPCLHHTDFPPCKGKNICMKNIKVIDVFDVVKKKIIRLME